VRIWHEPLVVAFWTVVVVTGWLIWVTAPTRLVNVPVSCPVTLSWPLLVLKLVGVKVPVKVPAPVVWLIVEDTAALAWCAEVEAAAAVVRPPVEPDVAGPARRARSCGTVAADRQASAFAGVAVSVVDEEAS